MSDEFSRLTEEELAAKAASETSEKKRDPRPFVRSSPDGRAIEPVSAGHCAGTIAAKAALSPELGADKRRQIGSSIRSYL